MALFTGGRRFAVLGDLLELGSFSAEAYRHVGQRAAQVSDFLVAQGDSAARVAEEAIHAGGRPTESDLSADQVLVTHTADDTLRGLAGQLRPGDTVLVKGARESRMEQVVAGLLADPTQAAKYLVRQTAGWRKVHLLRPARPTWLEVDLEAMAHNVRRVVDIVGQEVAVMAILKADGYGHGMVRVARTARNNGAGYLGVARINEGAMLSQHGISAPILVLGFTPAWQARELVLNDLTATVFNLDVTRALARAARELDSDVRVHVKVDTGVAQVKTLPPGSFVSYGNTYRTTGQQRIAVIPVGYADGFRWAPRHWGEVLVRGQRAPLVGPVCMDQTMVDVTNRPGVRQGDEVTLIGEQGAEQITAEDVAERLGTINHQMVGEILARAPRAV